eukprot:scaffold43971_cov80-Cyclotella_meneghiniana.AAC.4
MGARVWHQASNYWAEGGLIYKHDILYSWAAIAQPHSFASNLGRTTARPSSLRNITITNPRPQCERAMHMHPG